MSSGRTDQEQEEFEARCWASAEGHEQWGTDSFDEYVEAFFDNPVEGQDSLDDFEEYLDRFAEGL